MKKLYAVLLLLFTIGAQAQKVNQCGFVIPPDKPKIATEFASVYEAKSIVNDMLDKIRWQENFMLREQNGINNAYATIIQNLRYIIYDNDFLENLDYYAGTDWASISVMAHEMGHHYYNHVVYSSGSTPPKELEADYFSGYVMQRVGASLDEAMAAMNKLGTNQASATHPGKTDRLNAISKGWNYANSATGNTSAPKPTPPPTNEGNNYPIPTYPTPNPQPGNNNTNDPSWIYLTHSGTNPITIELSDNGSRFEQVSLKAGEPFVFKYEIYKYGWLRLRQTRGSKVYKLYHGRDYTIQWSRRQQSWVLVEVP